MFFISWSLQNKEKTISELRVGSLGLILGILHPFRGHVDSFGLCFESFLTHVGDTWGLWGTILGTISGTEATTKTNTGPRTQATDSGTEATQKRNPDPEHKPQTRGPTLQKTKPVPTNTSHR